MNKPYFLPEWAPVKAVVLAWPYPHGDWKNNINQVHNCYWFLLEALSNHVEVWLLLHPTFDKSSWQESLPEEVVVDWERVKVFNEFYYDDTWVRDYGPLSLSTKYITFTFNGWGAKYPAGQDNTIAKLLLEANSEEVTVIDFVCEGGGLETNGETLLVNKDCIVDQARNKLNEQEVVATLSSALGVTDIAWLEGIQLTGDDTDGHIDTIARFVNQNTLVYSGRNPNHVDAAALESLHSQLTGLAQIYTWQVHELPTPQITSEIDGRVLPATYANFLIVNDTVFVPIYGVEEDRFALQKLAEVMPQFRIIPVRCEALLEQHGSLHCATMQVAWV